MPPANEYTQNDLEVAKQVSAVVTQVGAVVARLDLQDQTATRRHDEIQVALGLNHTNLNEIRGFVNTLGRKLDDHIAWTEDLEGTMFDDVKDLRAVDAQLAGRIDTLQEGTNTRFGQVANDIAVNNLALRGTVRVVWFKDGARLVQNGILFIVALCSIATFAHSVLHLF